MRSFVARGFYRRNKVAFAIGDIGNGRAQTFQVLRSTQIIVWPKGSIPRKTPSSAENAEFHGILPDGRIFSSLPTRKGDPINFDRYYVGRFGKPSPKYS